MPSNIFRLKPSSELKKKYNKESSDKPIIAFTPDWRFKTDPSDVDDWHYFDTLVSFYDNLISSAGGQMRIISYDDDITQIASIN
jgi:hypothetical protein